MYKNLSPEAVKAAFKNFAQIPKIVGVEKGQLLVPEFDISVDPLLAEHEVFLIGYFLEKDIVLGTVLDYFSRINVLGLYWKPDDLKEVIENGVWGIRNSPIDPSTYLSVLLQPKIQEMRRYEEFIRGR